MSLSVSEKMGLRPGMRSYFADAPQTAIQAMDLPPLLVVERLTGSFDYIHLFALSQAAFRTAFPRLRDHLATGGSLWVSWPKSGQLGTDLKLTKVIELGYEFGLVESKSISIDAIWSALKFTHPRPGIVYNNSYGKLPKIE